MKQMDIKKEREETPPKEEGRYDVLISELALNDVCQDKEAEKRDQQLVSYLKDVIAEREKLFDISRRMESNPRVVKFIERILSGDDGKVAFESAGLSEFLDEIPLEQSEITPVDVSKDILTFYKEKGVGKDVASDFVAFVEAFVSQICQKEIDRNALEILWLAFMYENDVKKSYEEGVIKGQNKRIESLRFERNNVDGLGRIGGGAIANPQEKKLGYIERLLTNGF